MQEEKPKGSRAHVNVRFFKQLYQLLKIGIPSMVSLEMAFVLLIAGTLTIRSICDFWMINMITSVDAYVLIFLFNLDLKVWYENLLSSRLSFLGQFLEWISHHSKKIC